MATEKNNSAALLVRPDDHNVRFRDNSQSGKSKPFNVHDLGATLNLNTSSGSNTDLINAGIHQQVSFQGSKNGLSTMNCGPPID